MGKTGYFRWDVWMANLSQFGLENHFVVIISNFKNNTKSISVNCCLITSQLKKLSNRVNINLLTECQVSCETIFTIKKDKLLYKLTRIEDIFNQLEIEKALESQLQLSNSYINNDIELLEDYLNKGVNKMTNESKLINLKTEICNLALENKYEETIILCNKLIELTNNSDIENKNIYLWHSYYHRALIFNKLHQYQLALEDTRESLKFTGNLRDGINNRYSYSMWSLAKCYENLNNIEKANHIYKNLNKYYRSIGKTNMRIDMLFNLAKLNKNEKLMISLIDRVKSLDFREFETNKTKESLLKQMKEDLIQIML